MEGDRGDIVLGWLTKVVVVLSVLGVLSFDGISLVAGRFGGEDAAQVAVRAAVTAYREKPDVDAAYAAAVATLADPDDRIEPETFTVTRDGSVSLVLDRHVETLVLEHVGPAADWAELSLTVTAGRPT